MQRPQSNRRWPRIPEKRHERFRLVEDAKENGAKENVPKNGEIALQAQRRDEPSMRGIVYVNSTHDPFRMNSLTLLIEIS